MSEQQEAQPIGSFTIREWCKKHRIALSTFYELDKIGEAPVTYRIGNKIRRISPEADRAWVASREGR
jgi:hypothetical protein